VSFLQLKDRWLNLANVTIVERFDEGELQVHLTGPQPYNRLLLKGDDAQILQIYLETTYAYLRRNHANHATQPTESDL